jgi:hypothetical protein
VPWPRLKRAAKKSCNLDDFVNLLPLDDLHRVPLLVEELGDQNPADAVAVVLVAVDFAAMFEGVIGRFQGAHCGCDFRSGGYQDF